MGNQCAISRDWLVRCWSVRRTEHRVDSISSHPGRNPPPSKYRKHAQDTRYPPRNANNRRILPPGRSWCYRCRHDATNQSTDISFARSDVVIKIDGIEEHAWITRPINKQITVTTSSDVAVPFPLAKMITVIFIIPVATLLAQCAGLVDHKLMSFTQCNTRDCSNLN